MPDFISLGIDPANDYDHSRSIDIGSAAKLIGGKSAGGGSSPQVVMRYANPRHGYRPRGSTGPVLVLPTIRLGGELRTMPEWVEAFERERVRQGVRKLVEEMPPERPERSKKAAQRRAGKVLDRAGI